MANQEEPPLQLRAALAFDRALREGVEDVRHKGLGTIVVLGCDERAESLLGDGDRSNQPATAEAIFRAARDDGATILSVGLDRIIRKNTILNPDPTIPAAGSGSRHIVAERFAAQTGLPVIVISEERQSVTLFLGHTRHVLRRKLELHTEIADVVNALRAIVNLRKLGTGSQDPALQRGIAEARSRLVMVDGHLVELGEFGHALKFECVTLAAALGIVWTPSAIPHSSAEHRDHLDGGAVPSRPAVLGTHNEFSGTARNVLQAGRIDTVHLHSATVEIPAPHQLPPQVAHFTDRENYLTEVDAMLSDDGVAPKIFVMVGGPGIGKSAFVVHWAHLAEHRFPDGILHADLRGFHPTDPPADPADVLGGFLRDLGLPESAIRGDLDSKTRLSRSRMHGRRSLIVLDNARNPEQVRPLLPGASTCRVLITSRIAMTSLVVNEGAHRLALDLLPPGDAIVLLRKVIGTRDVDDAMVAELARLCGYHPLALCIAGARAASYQPDELDDLAEDLTTELLDALSDPDDHSASVRAAFSLSYKALPATTQRTFRLLGLHPGPVISAEAADVLTGDRPGIRRLVDAHLLEKAGNRRYRFHDLLRAYAAECAAESEPAEERHSALRRVLGWYQEAAEAVDYVLDPWRPRTSLASSGSRIVADRAAAGIWFDNELANLAAATQVALAEGEYEIAWRLALAPSAYFFSRKPWAIWIMSQEAGLAAARRVGERPAEAWLCDGLGVAHREQGHRDEAVRYFGIALTIWREIGDRLGEAETSLHLAQTYRERGELGPALESANTALSLFRAVDARHGEAKVLNLLGGIHIAVDDLPTALARTQEAVTIFEDLDDEHGHAWAVNNLGIVFAKLGHRADAIAAFRTAQTVRERIDRYGLAFTLTGLGDVLHADGRNSEAAECWRGALEIFDEIGDPQAERLRTCLNTITS